MAPNPIGRSIQAISLCKKMASAGLLSRTSLPQGTVHKVNTYTEPSAAKVATFKNDVFRLTPYFYLAHTGTKFPNQRLGEPKYSKVACFSLPFAGFGNIYFQRLSQCVWFASKRNKPCNKN